MLQKSIVSSTPSLPRCVNGNHCIDQNTCAIRMSKHPPCRQIHTRIMRRGSGIGGWRDLYAKKGQLRMRFHSILYYTIRLSTRVQPVANTESIANRFVGPRENRNRNIRDVQNIRHREAERVVDKTAGARDSTHIARTLSTPHIASHV